MSATGNASVTVNASQATITGGAVSLDANAVTLGQGASDYVALATLVLAAIARLETAYNTHQHVGAAGFSAPTTTPTILLVPALISPATTTVASTKVKCA